MDLDIEVIKKIQNKQYATFISSNLYDNLEKHILTKKKLSRSGLTKQNWVSDAIHEYLEHEKSEGSQSLQERRISIRIDILTLRNLKACVEKMKKSNPSYSLKKLLVHAIESKLEREKDEVKKKIDEYLETLKNKN